LAETGPGWENWPVANRERHQHDHGADQGGEIGVDALDADLGEDCGQRRKYGGQNSPELPG